MWQNLLAVWLVLADGGEDWENPAIPNMPPLSFRWLFSAGSMSGLEELPGLVGEIVALSIVLLVVAFLVGVVMVCMHSAGGRSRGWVVVGCALLGAVVLGALLPGSIWRTSHRIGENPAVGVARDFDVDASLNALASRICSEDVKADTAAGQFCQRRGAAGSGSGG